MENATGSMDVPEKQNSSLETWPCRERVLKRRETEKWTEDQCIFPREDESNCHYCRKFQRSGFVEFRRTELGRENDVWNFPDRLCPFRPGVTLICTVLCYHIRFYHQGKWH